MLRLKDRNGQIPHGLSFKLPEANWEGTPWSSLDTLARAAMEVGRANPFIAKKCNWPTTLNGWLDAIDNYNASICKAHGWTGYIREVPGGPPLPPAPPRPSSLQSAGGVVAGARILTEWLGTGGNPVAQELADARAHICADCPQNKQNAPWTSWFTVPAANGIRRMLELRNSMKLTTPDDDKLNVCDACGCPLKLKVHTPLLHIANNMPPYQKELLDARCWVLQEQLDRALAKHT